MTVMLHPLLKKYRKFVIFCLVVIAFFVVMILIFSWWFLKPLDPDGVPQEVVIEQGKGQQDIARQLQDEGIIRNKDAFLLYIQRTDTFRNLQAGTYQLSPAMSVQEIVRILTEGEIVSEEVQITFPEGLTVKEMDQLFVENNIFDEGVFEGAVTISYEEAYDMYGYEFLNALGDSSRDTLEGFLFPDTYKFFRDASVEDVVSRMLGNYEEKIYNEFDELRNRDDFLDNMIIASILQAEVSTETDMRRVAALIQNRLDANMALNMDSTIQYSVSVPTSGDLARAIDEYDGPYNTYKVRGLPPTPINNPGVEAIGAALNPIANDYLYFLVTPDGVVKYSKTLEEQTTNINTYLR